MPRQIDPPIRARQTQEGTLNVPVDIFVVAGQLTHFGSALIHVPQAKQAAPDQKPRHIPLRMVALLMGEPLMNGEQQCSYPPSAGYKTAAIRPD